MKIAQLLSIYPQWYLGEQPTADILGLSMDSRTIEPGFVYIAVKGTCRDGHKYIPQAINRGALALVVEDREPVPNSYKGAMVVVKDSRQALHELAARFYNEPAKKLCSFAVTGTNGKTSVTYMIEKILTEFGWSTGVIGTNNHHLGDRVWESPLTTPDPLTLHRRLYEFSRLGAQAMALEVSSHALIQKRADFIPFRSLIFTNLSRDHLDAHSTMEEYFQAKARLFNEVPWLDKSHPVYAVVNFDDSWGAKLTIAPGVRLWSYGQGESDFQFSLKNLSFKGSDVELKTLRGEARFHLPMLGVHNAYNATAAIAACISVDVPLETATRALENFSGVPGRLENVNPHHCKNVFVDYAHTDKALKTVLGVLRQVRYKMKSKGQIITVFGCGGNRDKGKRPLMAQVACEGSDIVILTSDNPRTEDPMAIIEDVKRGGDSGLKVQADRRLAIREAIGLAKPGDVVLIAGKGHENTQIVGETSYDFSDIEVAQEFLGSSYSRN